MKKIFWLLMIIFPIMNSCKKNSSDYYTAKAIVEAYLTPNQTVSLHLSSEIMYMTSDSAAGLDNLTPIISCNGQSYQLTSSGNGYYISDTTLHIIEGNTYSLEFIYKGVTVSSSTVIPTKPSGFAASGTSIVVQQFDPNSGTMPTFPDPIELTWNNPNHDYYMIVVRNIESTLVPTDTANVNKPAFRTQPTQSNTYKIQPMQFKYYGTHDIILYKLNPEYAALYNDNGSNSLNLTSPESNINNGWGIFTGINADTLQIEVTN
jgi:hypothetical protein